MRFTPPCVVCAAGLVFFENTSGVVQAPEPTAARRASLGEDAANY